MRRLFATWGLLLVSVAAGCATSAPLPAKAIALNREGAAAIVVGDLTTAEARIALALEYNPRFTEAWVNLGVIEMDRGNFDRAIRDFQKASDLNPDLPAPRHQLGLLAEFEGRYADAEKHYRAALKVDPGFVPSRVNLARRLFQRGALDEACEQFLRATQVAPAFVEAWAGLGQTLLRLKRIPDAERVLALARERFPDNGSVDLLAGRILLEQGDFAAAERVYGPVMANPDRYRAAEAKSGWALARLALGDPQSALRAAEDAVEWDPESELARTALAIAQEAVRNDPANR